jgi:RNA polymerase sigma factor (TIGR02999 family)
MDDIPESSRPTLLLEALAQGDQAAFNELLLLVHDEHHRLSHRHMNHERRGHTLQATALVNEAYLRLIDVNQVQWQSRAHFFSMASRAMRRVLVDSARTRNYQKRGGGAQKVSLDEALLVTQEPGQDLVALDDALNALGTG